VCGPAAVEAAASAPECPDCLLAGAASVPLRVPAGTPLAGYGSLSRRRGWPALFDRGGHAVWFKSHTGVRDPLRVRALVLDHVGTRVVWIALDVIAVDASFTERVRAALRQRGGPAATVLVSASHTHSGPGAFLDSWLMGLVAADLFDRAVREAMVESVLAAVAQAETRRVPTTIATARVTAPSLTKGRLGAPGRSDLLVMKLTNPAGKPLALVWNYAIHGTMLSARNLELSGDVMGVASALLERELGVPALFVNGTVGDASPAGHGAEAMARTAAALTSAVRGAVRDASTTVTGPLTVRTTRVALPEPGLSLRNCAGNWVPTSFRLPLGFALPDSVELTAVGLGDIAVVTMPGELQGRLAEKLQHGVSTPWRHVMVAGVSNDYLGYFVSAADYARPAYVTCAALYGPDGGERLTTAQLELLRSLAGSTRRTPDRGARRAGAPRSAARGEATRERGLLAGGGVRVDHTLRDGLVERADRLADGLGGVGAGAGASGGAGRLARCLDRGADAGADRPIAQSPPLALPHLLHRRLRVRHREEPPSRKMRNRAASCPNATGIAT
jgi:hypothetical protein